MDAVITDSKPNVKRTGKRKKAVRIIAFFMAAVLIAVGVYIYFRFGRQNKETVVTQRTATVIRGRLVSSIAGSAPVVSSSRSELSPKVTATLLQINCREGDQVKAGDVLFVLDNTDALLDIENTKNSIAQMELTIDSTKKSIGGLTVKAPYPGQVTGINVKEGDTVNKGGALMTLTDVSRLNVTLPFSGPAAEAAQLGQTAVVYIPDLMISLEGNVTYKSSKPYISASGISVYNIEITLENPGYIAEGMHVNAEIAAGEAVTDSVESGTLSYAGKKVIRSEAGGTVTKLSVRENEVVDAGDILVKLENDDLFLTSSTNEIKYENLKSQLEIQMKQLEYYTIKAPFDGTITSMGRASEGDTVKQGEMLAVVSDMNRLEFSIDIDELDISQIAAGQQVMITAEALEESQTNPFTGKVSKVAMEGSSQNGVTTYPVTVSVDENAAGKLKTGMNIDAEIYIFDKQNVLMVPVEAVTKIGGRSFVYVSGTEGSTQAGDDADPTAGWRNAGNNNRPGGWPGMGSMPDADQNSQQGTEPNTDQNSQQTTAPGAGRNFRQRTIPNADQNSQQTAVPETDQNSQQGTEPNTDQNSQQTTAPGAGRNFRQRTMPNVDQNNQQTTVPDTDQNNQQATVPSTDRNSQQNNSSGADRNSQQSTRPNENQNDQQTTVPRFDPDAVPTAPGIGGSGPQNAAGRRTGWNTANADPYYEGFVMVEVETGISNDTYIEIISGLSEGQKVLLPKTSTSAASNTARNSQQNRTGGMMGGGGIPMGGMPMGGFGR